MPLSVEEGGTPIAPSARCRRVKRPAGKLAKSSVHDKDAEIQRRFIVIRSAHPMPNDMMRPAWRARSRGRAERRTRPTSTAPRAHGRRRQRLARTADVDSASRAPAGRACPSPADLGSAISYLEEIGLLKGSLRSVCMHGITSQDFAPIRLAFGIGVMPNDMP
ncbi:hypothetical protein L3054_10820, partial [Corynebacterium sp. MC-10]|nr:hypothetical protein [Corynebacterium parakroppenstedtii]